MEVMHMREIKTRLTILIGIHVLPAQGKNVVWDIYRHQPIVGREVI